MVVALQELRWVERRSNLILHGKMNGGSGPNPRPGLPEPDREGRPLAHPEPDRCARARRPAALQRRAGVSVIARPNSFVAARPRRR